jgi:hypothetical protein
MKEWDDLLPELAENNGPTRPARLFISRDRTETHILNIKPREKQKQGETGTKKLNRENSRSSRPCLKRSARTPGRVLLKIISDVKLV